ncbi:hypothetical protein ACP70R_042426 [Stipagrostis hirtigluma subsp. patula]
MAPATAAAAFTRALPAAAAATRVSPAAASAFVRVPPHTVAWPAVSVAAPRGRRRAPGVAYATAATEKTIYDYTVKWKLTIANQSLSTLAIRRNVLEQYVNYLSGFSEFGKEKDIDGKDVPLSKFKGKALLIVNVASQCGLTTSNYTELSHLYEKYKTQGFEILAFPCNQFGAQEPGSNPQIKQFACTRFKAEFPIFDKVDVNGPNTAPIYKFLKSSAGGFLGDLVKWNFEKFLVDKNGKVVERYPPTTSPFQIEFKDIQKLLAAEYGMGGRPSTQGDVYSFGVMLLEMITGRRPTDVISEEGHGLHEWVKSRCLQHDVDAVLERSPLRDLRPSALRCEMEVVVELLELGVACSLLAPSTRPSMDEVAREIACLRDVVREESTGPGRQL